jgi:hypothetical protein
VSQRQESAFADSGAVHRSCQTSSVPLIWVTGNSGVGKSTVQRALTSRGELAIEADWEGYSQWVHRTSGQVVNDSPYPVPPGWLERFAWRISRSRVEELSARANPQTTFLCGSAENDAEVRDLFDLLVCLVVDNETLRRRLRTRTTNAFGRNPDEIAAALAANDHAESTYRRLGAIIIDGTRPLVDVTDATLAAVQSLTPRSHLRPAR